MPIWSTFSSFEKSMELYKAGFHIFESGESIKGIFIVYKGLVTEYISSYGNNTEIIRFADDGNVLGQMGFENDVFSFNAKAKEDTIICRFENKTLFEMYLSNSKIVFDLMVYFSNQYSNTVYRLKCIARMNMREKVAEALLYIVKNFGFDNNNEFSNRFNREDIANLISTSQEQVSRQLSDFEKEEIIEKRGRSIVITNLEKLKDVIKEYNQ